MKEKNTKHHEKKICIITEIIFFHILSCQFESFKIKNSEHNPILLLFSSIESQFKLKLSRYLNKLIPLEISSVKVFLKSDLFYLSNITLKH